MSFFLGSAAQRAAPPFGISMRGVGKAAPSPRQVPPFGRLRSETPLRRQCTISGRRPGIYPLLGARPHLEGSLPRPPGDFLPAQDKRRHPLLSDASFCTWVLAPRREAAGHGCQGSVLSAAPRPTSRKYVPLIFSSRWSRFRSWSIWYSVRWASTSSSARPVVTMVSTVW